MSYSPFGKAGWYPNEPDELKKMIKNYCNTNDFDGPVSALICPHAGYKYSGKICGHAFGATKYQKIEHVIIIGPSHYINLKETFCIPNFIKMETEIGSSSVNKKFLANFKDDDNCTINNAIFDKEHSIWMMLPFIQYLHPNSTISPMIVGQLKKDTISSISEKITSILTKNTLLIISSDFTHYGAVFNYTPFVGFIPNEILKFDEIALNFIKEKNSQGFWDWMHENETTICGRYAISVLLASLTNQTVKSTQYLQSGSLANDWSHSVSYQSVVFGQ